MFGVQTFFLSKSIGYLIRISLFSVDNTFLDKEIFTLFLFWIKYYRLVFVLCLQFFCKFIYLEKDKSLISYL